MANDIDEKFRKELANAKFTLLADVARDPTLSRLALRAVILLATSFMNGLAHGIARASLAAYCAELGISKTATLSEALGELVANGYLEADRRNGARSYFWIARRFFPDVTVAYAGEFARALRREDGKTIPQNGERSDKNPSAKRGTDPSGKRGTGIPQNGEGFCETVPQNGEAIITKDSITNPMTDKSIHGARVRAGESDGADLFGQGEEPRSKGKTSTKKTRKANSAVEAALEEIWPHYPRHVGKAAGLRALDKAMAAGADPIEIKAAVMRFAAQRMREEPDPVKRDKFTPHFSTWLNGRRWEDAPPPQPDTPHPFTTSRPQGRPERWDPFEAAFYNYTGDDHGE